MSQPLQSINLVAPGFKGINTEDSPMSEDYSFADVADNAVIDKRGRIASRKGVRLWTQDNQGIGDAFVKTIHHFFDDVGNEAIFVTANQRVFMSESTTDYMDTLTDVTPAGYLITNDDWKIVNFNGAAYFFQVGLEPLVYTHDEGLRTYTEVVGADTNPRFFCHEAIAAYGRLFVVDNGADKQIVSWSDLLIGTDFEGGSSGSIEVNKAWPDGHDEVVALAAHNDKLIVFGMHSILVYADAFSPSMMVLDDTVSGVGCIDRNSVQTIGTDVLFMDKSGLRSFGRVIQEKSLPLSDLSVNVKTDLIAMIDNRVGPVSSVFSPEHSFYLLTLPEERKTFCFDVKGRLENNSFRVTEWTLRPFTAWERRHTDGKLLTGTKDGLGEYSGYSDEVNNGGNIEQTSYLFRYYSPSLTFGDPSKLKFLKKIRPTVIGANTASVRIKWAYDFSSTFSTAVFGIGSQIPYYYSSPKDDSVGFISEGGLAEYSQDGLAEYTGGELTTRPPINATGSGSVVTIGLESDINGFALSLQEINVLALMGKTL